MMLTTKQTYFFASVAYFIAAAVVDNGWSLGLGFASIVCTVLTYVVED
jgi:hypothetical protein